MKKNNKILIVIPKNIFPVNDGAKRANYSLLKSVSLLKKDVDLLIFNEGPVEESQYKKEFSISQVFLGVRENYRSQWHRVLVLLKEFICSPFTPMSANVFKQNKNLNLIKSILKENDYDSIIFDGLHPYQGFEKILNIKKNDQNFKLIYRAHNVESDIWFTKAAKTKNLILRLFINYQGNLIGKLEKRLMEKAHNVWTISDEDQVVFKAQVPSDKYKTIPVGMNFRLDEKLTDEKYIYLMFLGKLDWDPNREGLQWFFNTIWPFVKNERLKLTVAGSGDGKWLSKYSDFINVNFLGMIDDVADLYLKSDYSIVPIQFGSGTRIKVIESISFGVPVISTQMGIQGSGVKPFEYINAESTDEWIKTLNSLSSKKMENFKSLQNRFFDCYSYLAISNKISKDISSDF